MSSIYTFFTLTEIPNACLILEKKHVRVLFEGNILLTAWLQDLHRVNFTELTLFFSSAGDFSLTPSSAPQCHCAPCSGFVYFPLWETFRNIHWLTFLFLLLPLPPSLSLSLSLFSAVFCEQTITCWRNNKSLLGNGTTSFCFQLINLMYLKFRCF